MAAFKLSELWVAAPKQTLSRCYVFDTALPDEVYTTADEAQTACVALNASVPKFRLPGVPPVEFVVQSLADRLETVKDEARCEGRTQESESASY